MRLTRIALLRYEMYAEDSRTPSVAHQRDDGDGAHAVESGPAIEVIELANGETIWWAPRFVSLDGNFVFTHALLAGRS